MSEQWVDRQGFLRNSSGRYRQGDTPPYVTESKADEERFEAAKGYVFHPAPGTIWSFACQPKLGALLQNTASGTLVGIEIDHARALRAQLDQAIRAYDKLKEDMVTKPDETKRLIAQRGGMTITPLPAEPTPSLPPT